MPRLSTASCPESFLYNLFYPQNKTLTLEPVNCLKFLIFTFSRYISSLLHIVYYFFPLLAPLPCPCSQSQITYTINMFPYLLPCIQYCTCSQPLLPLRCTTYSSSTHLTLLTFPNLCSLTLLYSFTRFLLPASWIVLPSLFPIPMCFNSLASFVFRHFPAPPTPSIPVNSLASFALSLLPLLTTSWLFL
jgi:hypothetical protein